MAQTVTIAGATYPNVPSVELPKSGGGTAVFADTSDATATAADIASGKTAYAGGVKITGTGSGGGSASVAHSDVNFYDYDGTVVASYTASDFAALAALPDNPVHDGLTAQGWNWTLADAKTYVASYGRLDIGQMYITSDGKTRVYIHLEEGRLSPMLGVCPNGTVTVDWGDGTATATLTGTSVSTVKWTSNHTYAAAGDYVITLAVSGSMGLMGEFSYETGSYLLRHSSGEDNRNCTYHGAIRRVEIGSGVTSIGDIAFTDCYSLASITIPTSVTSIGTYAFTDCYSLASITIPTSVTSIGDNAFIACYSLASITIPTSVTSIGDSAFYDCYSLASITIPTSVTSIGTCAFQYCISLAAVAIPTSVTSIGDSAFYGCFGLASITIPSGVTSIRNYAFGECYGLGFIKFTRSTPPTVSGSSAWSNVPADCVIYVPSGSLSAYTSATNYPSSSTYTYVEY